jgi:hypothetical protein
MKRTHIFSVLTILIICILLPNIGFAQVVVVVDPGCDPFDLNCPIDGGVSLLIAAGIGIGAKKAYQERNKKKAVAENAAN